MFGLTSEQCEQVVRAGIMAPSLLNSQPWAFRLGADRIEVYIDPARTLPVGDPDGRQARLGVGAAVFNMTLALARCGLSADVRYVPGGDDPVAVICNGGDVRLSPQKAELARAIPYRRTNRHPFFHVDVPVGYQQTLVRAAEADQASLRLITDCDRLAQLREWATEAERAQSADPSWVAEWMKWMQWTRRKGLPDGESATAAGAAPQGGRMLRDFGMPERPAGRDVETEPLLAVLGTPLDTPSAQIAAGQALQRVLLTATGLGLAASLLSQMIEVDSVRGQVEAMVGGRTHAQAVLRIGYGGPVPAAPRRTVQDCLLPRSAGQC